MTTPFEIDPITDHVDDPTIREIFADGVRVVSCIDGILQLELTVRRPHLVGAPPLPPKLRTHTVGRLAVTTAVGAQIAKNIQANLDQQGVLKAMTPVTPASQPKH
jgi:hypothetical protein